MICSCVQIQYVGRSVSTSDGGDAGCERTSRREAMTRFTLFRLEQLPSAQIRSIDIIPIIFYFIRRN